MAVITSNQEISKLRTSGWIAAQVLQDVIRLVKPGVITSELNTVAEKNILKLDGRPSFKGFEGFPAGLCTSINEEIVHGLPGSRILRDGDIIGLDIGVEYQGLFSDHAITVGVGTITPINKKLILDTEQALHRGLKAVKPGQHIGDIGAAIEAYLKPLGYGIITQLTGHGVGHAVHEPPAIHNVGPSGTGPIIEVGMVLAIEPMVSLGQASITTLDDGWTVVMKDKSNAAHAEHTVLVTKHGCDIITLP